MLFFEVSLCVCCCSVQKACSFWQCVEHKWWELTWAFQRSHHQILSITVTSATIIACSSFYHCACICYNPFSKSSVVLLLYLLKTTAKFYIGKWGLCIILPLHRVWWCRMSSWKNSTGLHYNHFMAIESVKNVFLTTCRCVWSLFAHQKLALALKRF